MAVGIAKGALWSVTGLAAVAGVTVATNIVPMEPLQSGLNDLKQRFDQSLSIAKKVPNNPEKTDAPGETATALLMDTAKPAEQKQAVAEIKLPKFDILRVEKDGSLLAAGNTTPNSKVELLGSDGKVVAETKSGPQGDFVVIPDNPLAAGDHALTFRSTTPKGKTIVSAETGVVHIPKVSGGEILAMVTKDGDASRVLIKPESLSEAAQPKQPEVKVAEASEIVPAKPKAPSNWKVETQPQVQAQTIETPNAQAPTLETPKQPETQLAAKSGAPKNDETEVAVVAPKEPVKPAPVINSKSRIAVEAVEVEGEKLFVAGAADFGSKVRVYVDNEPVGVASGTGNHRFVLEEKYKLSAGEHVVRADVVSKSTGEVVARAEVPLVHQPRPATTAAKSEPTKTAEAATPTPKTSQANWEKVKVPELMQPELKSQEGVAVQIAKVETKPETAVTPSIEPIRTGTSLIIKRGDNLWRISRKTYGAGVRYTTIYKANLDQIRDPSRIYVGQIFKIPAKAVN